MVTSLDHDVHASVRPKGLCSECKLDTWYLPGFELVWPWDTFLCAFEHRGATSVGVATLEGLGSNPSGERMIFCPVPEPVIAAVRHSGLRTIVLSIFADPHNATAIIDGVQLAIYKKKYYDIAMHTMIKDVGGELVQWIEYHRCLPVASSAVIVLLLTALGSALLE